MPESVALETRKRIGHISLCPFRRAPAPVEVEGLGQFEGRFYEVLPDLTLNNQVHHREENERLVGSLKAREG
jgi:hypothetical protein